MSGNSMGSATGISGGEFPLDAGDYSYVAFGIYDFLPNGDVDLDTLRFAYAEPQVGETTADILEDLVSQFLAMSIPATYDSVENTLFLDAIGWNQAVWWNNTDTGLEFSMGMGAVVPLPGALALLASSLGSLGLAAWARRRRH